MPEADARARIAAQAHRGGRLAVADLVVANDGDLSALAHRVDGPLGRAGRAGRGAEPGRRRRRPTCMTAARLLRCSLGAVLLAAVVVLLPAGAAMACSCVEAPPDRALLGRSDVVFTGKLVERHDPTVFLGLSSSTDPAVLVFAVETVHKGSVAQRQGIETARSGATCGLELTQGRRALVFADGSTGTSWARCAAAAASSRRRTPAGRGATLDGVLGPGRRRMRLALAGAVGLAASASWRRCRAVVRRRRDVVRLLRRLDRAFASGATAEEPIHR